MKLILLFLSFLLTVSKSIQTQSACNWYFSVRKISTTKYEIHCKAILQQSWHIYSQHTPSGGPVRTSLEFLTNPLITMDGKPKEFGKLITKHEELFGVDIKYYEGSVDFVQSVSLRNKINTQISGAVQFMVCNDKLCLPVATQNFSIDLK